MKSVACLRNISDKYERHLILTLTLLNRLDCCKMFWSYSTFNTSRAKPHQLEGCALQITKVGDRPPSRAAALFSVSTCAKFRFMITCAIAFPISQLSSILRISSSSLKQVRHYAVATSLKSTTLHLPRQLYANLSDFDVTKPTSCKPCTDVHPNQNIMGTSQWEAHFSS